MGLGLLVGAEIAVAKTLDYTGSTVSRAPGSPHEAFFAQMARMGLEQGWDDTGKALPWWYGAMSAGMTGATDFLAGQVIGGLLRAQALEALAQHPALRGAFGTSAQVVSGQGVSAQGAAPALPKLAHVLSALRGEDVPGLSRAEQQALHTLAELLTQAGDGAVVQQLLDKTSSVELRAPVTRHLKRALVDPGASEFAGFVERNMLSESAAKGGALGGTIVGHGIAGYGTGLLTGHPELGAIVTLLDSLTEGLLAQKALSGKYEALTTLKCAMLLQGMREAERPPDWKGKLGNALVGFYSQMGEEVRLFGEDLARLAHALDDDATQSAAVLAQQVAALAGEQVARAVPTYDAESPAEARTRARAQGFAKEQTHKVVTHKATSLLEIARAQAHAARDVLEHHGEVGMAEALAHDFAEERARLHAALESMREVGALVAEEFTAVHPELSRSLATLDDAVTAQLMLLKVQAQEIVAGGRARFTHASASAGASSFGSRGATAACALGRSILHAAQRIFAPLSTHAHAAWERSRKAAREGAFAFMDTSGTLAVKGLLTAEAYARAHEEQLAKVGATLARVHELMAARTVALLAVLKQSTSAGATALGDLVIRASEGFAITPHNALQEIEWRARLARAREGLD